MNRNLSSAILVFVLIFGVLLVYVPHYNYGYPLHVDEWNLISELRVVQNEGVGRLLKYPIESGFVFTLFLIDLLFPVVLIYKFLPSLNFLLIGLTLFYFLKKKYGYWPGIFAILFFASLRSNVNLLGNWFFVPITFAGLFIYSCLFNLDKSLDKRENMVFVVLFLFLLAFIHPSSFLVLCLTTLIYYGINYRKIERGFRMMGWFFFLLIPSLLMVHHLTGFFSNLSLYRFLNFFVWDSLIVQINFNPIFFYGVLSSFFAVYGFILAHKKKELLGFRIYVSISLISMFVFWFIGKTLFSSYQRYLYHFMLGAVVFSAIGFYEFLHLIYVNMRKYKNELKLFVILLILIISFVFIFSNYNRLDEQVELYHVIDGLDYDAMKFLRDYDNGKSYSTGGVIFAPRLPGTGIMSITHLKSLGTINYYHEEYNQITEEFFSGDCNTKKLSFNNWESFEYVYSYEEIHCPFLREIYKNDKVFLYEEFRS